jgi:hypothetical protein
MHTQLRIFAMVMSTRAMTPHRIMPPCAGKQHTHAAAWPQQQDAEVTTPNMLCWTVACEPQGDEINRASTPGRCQHSCSTLSACPVELKAHTSSYGRAA